MPEATADWLEIETEYRLGDLTVEEICKEHRITVDVLYERAAAGGWDNPHGEGLEAIHPKYVLLVDEYLKDWDKKKAGERAGLGHLSVNVLFKNPSVRNLLRQRLKDAQVRGQISLDAMLANYQKIINADLRKLYHADGTPKKPHELDDETAFAVSSMEVRDTQFGEKRSYKMLDKLAAIHAVAKHLGAFTEKVEVTGKDGGPIETQAVPTEELARRVAFLLTQAQPTKETPA